MNRICTILFLSVGFILTLFTQCKDNTPVLENYPPPAAEDKEVWLSRMNADVKALKDIVLAIVSDDSITSVVQENNEYSIHFADTQRVSFQLDNATYPAPLIGAHKIDDAYFWTRINGTGTSATVLLKDTKRSNYEITAEGATPSFDIVDGAWMIRIGGTDIPMYDAEGKRFRAIGMKSLFKDVSFDIDSNMTVITNEVPSREYVLPRKAPLTLLMALPDVDTLTVAAGFALPIDFQSSGVETLDFHTPKGWSATHEFADDMKSGVVTIHSPTGLEEEFEESGTLEVVATHRDGRQLHREIPVKSEVGLVNFASVVLADLPGGLVVDGAKLTFAASLSSTDVKEVTALKSGDEFRFLLADGFPELRKATFTTNDGEFDYYFEPGTTVAIGEQALSVKPPKLLSFWQGGVLVEMNETTGVGIDQYHITGKVVHLQIGPKLPWFPNGNVDVSTANSTTNGATNTDEIIKALGGIGTSANYIARWAVRIRDGGYDDWYLGAERDYEVFHQLRAQNISRFDATISSYGGTPLSSGDYNTFWTSTNINQTQARMYDPRWSEYITAGTKVYGCFGLSFRNIN